MKRLREKVRDRTGRQPQGLPIEWIIEELNPILRGWGNYFRTGNAATKFRQIDRYVVWRLRACWSRSGDATCAPGRPISGPRTGSTSRASTGSAAPSATRRLRNHVKKTIGKPCAGKPHARIERGMGKQASRAPAPLTTNDRAGSPTAE